MKVAIVLLLSTSLSVAARSYSQDVTITGKNVSLATVFEAIHQQTGYSFVYEPKLLKRTTTVTVDFRRAAVTEILDACLKGQGLAYEIKFRTIVISEAVHNPVIQPADHNPANAPPKIVKGKVTDENGQPMAGVTITVKGSSKAVTTDMNGDFTISVPDEKASLTFSYVGFATQERSVGSASVINIKLGNDNKSLNQMIVVGYGTQKKGNITGAVASYNAKDIQDRPIQRTDQALVGQMAGVQVKETTGVPGKAFSIQVRGSGSITAGSEPLYVIDGFPLSPASPGSAGSFSTGNPLDNINANDIESIQVLKDASAAAIYGSRAANGVVLITTRQGRSGKAKLGFNVYAGASQASKRLGYLTPQQWVDRAIEMINDAWVLSGPNRTADQTSDQRRQILGLAPGQVNTLLMIDDRWTEPGHPGLRYIDWQDVAFRTGLTQNYQLSANGGNEFVKYYISGNYAKDQGIVHGVDYTSYSVRANVEATPSKNLKFGLNLTPTYSISNDPGVEGIAKVIQSLDFSPVQEDTMGLYPNSFNNGQYKWGTSSNSPLATMQNVIGRTQSFRTLTSIYGEYRLLDGLNFKTTLNLDNTDNTLKNYTPYTVTGPLTSRQTQPNVGTSGSYNTFRKQTFVNENTLSYNKTINDVHAISAVAGFSYNTDKLNISSLSSLNGYTSSTITTLNAASAVTGYTTETKDVLLSYFGRLQYSYNNRYLISGSLRRDGSSRFGADTKWGIFPSASVGWRVSEEKFMKDISLINDLKLRASWGQSGNYNIGDYSSLPLLAVSNYSFNSVPAYGQAPGGIVNPDLTWEKSQTLDFGLDVSLLNSRITAAFDYYNKLNTSLLLNVPIPGSTGFATYLNNAGKVRNKGWEIEVNTRNVTAGDFQWTTSINVSHNTNKVVALAGGQTQIFVPSLYDVPHSILKVGSPIYSINVVKQIGILTQDDINKHVALFGSETAGDPKYFDANGDGVIDANDRVIVGHPSPDYTWGVTNGFHYKGFDLSVLVQGQDGGSIYSLLGRANNRTGQDYTANVLNTYTKRGKYYSTFGRIVNTDWLYSSNYFRVRNITLGYDLSNTVKKSSISHARVYVTAENYFGKDKYYGGYNPEAANTDLSGSAQFPEAGDYGSMPLPKSIIVGLNITF